MSVVVVVGGQWGDEGKGGIVDLLAARAQVVARYSGGNNAGHTVIHGSQKFVLQLIPCGVLRPGCKGVIGNGVVLDPIAFLKEVAKLRGLGWEPATSFAQGLAETVAWYRDNRWWWEKIKSGEYSEYYQLLTASRQPSAGPAL